MSEPAKSAAASSWVVRHLPPARHESERALDVACGAGRHIALARERGYRVTGIDRDLGKARASELANDPDIELIEADLETGLPFPGAAGAFTAVIVTNYLWRPILPDIAASVAPQGVLIYETFGLGNERFGKPSNPDFLLRPGEILEAVAGRLTPLVYQHVRLAQQARIVQRLCAVGPDHEWLRLPPGP